MTISNPKSYYSHFLKGHEGKLHFAAHSHHFWPDVSRNAQLQYWDDCALLSDAKWGKVFGEIIPGVQKHIARLLNIKDHEQIALAPNTHELSLRLISLFWHQPKIRILTSSNEFYSWRRQFLRLQELPQIEVTVVDSQEFPTYRSKFLDTFKTKLKDNYDLAFVSQVFFDSGCALTDAELQELAQATPSSTVLAIDGYHGFAALPCDLSSLEGKIFYLGGGYKYAQGGEGIGFMLVPKGDWRPAYTGWLGEVADLSRPGQSQVEYAKNGMSFMGATQDPSGFYRFKAVWDLWQKEGLSLEAIHHAVTKLQQEFLTFVPASFLESWQLKPIFSSLEWHGHFLTYESPNVESAEKLEATLKQASILIDRRGKRLRFGFGLYQDLKDVHELCERLKNLARPPQ